MLYQVNEANTTKAHTQMLLDHHILVPVREPVFIYRECILPDHQVGPDHPVVHHCEPGFALLDNGGK